MPTCNRHLRTALLTVMLSLGMLGTAEAQEALTPFQFFDAWCMRSDPDFDRILSLAGSRGWPELSSKVLNVLSPLVDPDKSKGWIAGDDAHPLQVLVITRGSAGSETVNGCTVGLSSIDTVSFEKAVTARLGITPQGEERDGERIYKKYLVSEAGQQKLVTLSLPLAVDRPGEVVASVIEARH